MREAAAKYLAGAAATCDEGDWNGAPGGKQGSSSQGDGLFNQLDIVSALGVSSYLTRTLRSSRWSGRARRRSNVTGL